LVLTETFLQRSHAQMQEEDGSASPAWRYNPFPDNGEPALPFHTGLPLFNDYAPASHYDERRAPTHDNYGPPSRYQNFDERRIPTFEPALRFPVYEPSNSLSRPHIERPSSASAVHSHTAGLHLPRIENMASSTPRRYAGDGLDYRRPVSSAREQDAGSVDLTGEEEDIAIDMGRDETVIDLTADDSGYGASQDDNNGGQQGNSGVQQQSDRARRTNIGAPRLPRGMDIIIDLDNGEEEWRMATPVPQPGSPEIEFISSRPIDPRSLRPPTFGGSNSDGDEVEFVRENALPEAEVRRRRNRELDNVMDLFGTLNGRFTHLRAQVDRFNAQVNRTANRFHEPIVPTRSASRGHAHVRVGAFVAPIMDFGEVAFEIGPRVRVPEPPPPTYDAPEKAPEGFTRSPDEEGALVCPNCGDELCVGGDEVKRQVWIVKACGHVSSSLKVR
jgi:hypothetical protein